MTFDIRFLAEPRVGVVDGEELEGVISLGTEREGFLSPIGFWSREDYEAQWREGVRRVALAKLSSCLMVAVDEPSVSDALGCWVLYPLGDQVVIRELLMFRSELPSTFDPQYPYDNIPCIDESATVAGELPVSEWQVTAQSLLDFLRDERVQS